MRSKILISTSLRNYFCASLSSLPSIPSLKGYLTQPFDNKIPIESHCYKEWKQEIGDMVDEHSLMVMLQELLVDSYHINVKRL